MKLVLSICIDCALALFGVARGVVPTLGTCVRCGKTATWSTK